MTSRIRRQLTAAIALCLVHPAFAAPTMAVERPDLAATVRAPWTAEPAASDAEPTSHVSAAMAEIPLRFEPNVGQTDGQVAFVARGAGYGAFLTREDLVLSLPRATHAAEAGKSDIDIETAPSRLRRAETEALPPAVVRMRLTGADMSRPVGELPIETKTNYFIGDDPAGWHTDVPNFARVRYTDVYPGVDLVFYGDGGGLEYDVVVAPGADPSALTIDWEGAETVATDAAGALVLTVDGGELRMMAPVVYQEADEIRTPVAGSFEPLGGGRVGLSLGAYDPAKPLVIDPVLAYSTFLGGVSSDDLHSIAVDASGSVYVIGATFSTNFPTASPYDASYAGGQDVVVSKLSSSGSSLVFSTYLGGSAYENSTGLALDSSGAAYVVGTTSSPDFPTRRAYESSFNGGAYDAFVTKLTRAGELVYSTYLGGSAGEFGWSVAIGRDGDAYVAGETDSTNFPTAHPLQATLHGGTDAFVARLHFDAMLFQPVRLEYATYLGGSGFDGQSDIAVDDSGAAYLVGTTDSTNFPVVRAIDASSNGDFDGFVSKVKPDGSGLLFSTYLGGASSDIGRQLALDPGGAMVVSGYTYSADFPTTSGSFDRTLGGAIDAFVTKLSPGSVFGPAYVITFSTFVGGSGVEYGNGIAVGSDGTVYVAGGTTSPDFPTARPYDATFNSGYDAFVTKLSADGASLVYSTYLGAGEADYAQALAVDASGAAYVAGSTGSPSFPRVNAYDSSYNGGATDGFIAKLQ